MTQDTFIKCISAIVTELAFCVPWFLAAIVFHSYDWHWLAGLTLGIYLNLHIDLKDQTDD